MGKEHDLLEAARTGNITVVDKILSVRARRSGPLAPLASLRRSANPNCQDSNGYTPLHHAALNGHSTVVQMLLRYEASTNIMESKGCYPLHLAAWNGNTDICRTLLTQGPSIAKVNEQNNDGEAALHCASQYGHLETVSVLVEFHADASIRNFREETPLDLACQYGRLETVQLLLKTHPNLLCDNCDSHSPLHLASRNGHKPVVFLLLEEGFDINTKTETGSALHEASLFGKQDIVRLLLDYGIDPNITDSVNRTVVEVISDHKSAISLDIGTIIADYLEGRKNPSKRTSFASSSSASSSARQSVSSAVYDDVPPPKPVRSHTSSSSSLVQSDTSLSYPPVSRSPVSHTPVTHPPVRPQKPERKDKHRKSLEDRESAGCETGEAIYDSPRRQSAPIEETEPIYDTPAPPIPVPIIATPGSSSPSSASYTSSTAATPATPASPSTASINSSTGAYSPNTGAYSPSPGAYSSSSGPFSPSPSIPGCSPIAAAIMNRPSPKGSPRNSPTLKSPAVNISPDTPKKPPRRKKEALRRMEEDSNKKRDNERMSWGSKESLSRSITSEDRKSGSFDALVDNRFMEETSSLKELQSAKNRRVSESEEKKDPEKKDDEKEFMDKSEDDPDLTHSKIDTSDLQELINTMTFKIDSNKERNSVSEKSTSSSRPPSLEFGSKRNSRIEPPPLSPTGYEQPPTPDHPPPSPMTALLGIQEKINPNEKRRSRDMETITEREFLALEEAYSGTSTPSHSATSTPIRTLCDAVTETLGGSSESSPCHTPDVAIKPSASGGKGVTVGTAVEVITNGTDPFLGLTKGSIPIGQRRVKSQIYDNLVIGASSKYKQKRISAPGPFGFDPLDEKEEGKEESLVKDVMEEISKRLECGETVTATGSTSERKMDTKKGVTNGESSSKSEDTSSSPLIDENEEWAKIADIMASFGGGISRGSLYLQDCEQQLAKLLSGGRQMQSVGDWLESLGLPQYENTLVANGFDDMDFMSSNVLDDSDLIELGVLDCHHRERILQGARHLPLIKSICETGMPDSVESWLRSLRLSEYLDVFHSNGFTTMNRVKNIWELELNTVLDISTLGHRKRVLASLRRLPDDDNWSQGTGSDIVDIVGAINWNPSPLDNDGIKDDDTTTSPNFDINLFRDYTGLRSLHRGSKIPRYNDQDLTLDANGQLHLDSRDPQLSIRPPHLAHSESPIKQWRHRPEVLIRGCCNYSAQYLGSTMVRHLQGTESTKESINKLKKSAESVGKSPVILLSISYKGVKFIDAKSKKVICEHEIGNIFCACQDGDHMNYFAYITKDLDSNRHYCHVFCVKSTELATEIILTLGEAFEIAYQIALRKDPEDEEEEEEEECGAPQRTDSLDSNRRTSDSLDSPTKDRIESAA